MTITATNETTPAGVDVGLRELSLRAESGEEVAPLNVLAGGWLVQGRVVSSQAFVDATYQSTYNDLAASNAARKLRARKEELERILVQATEDRLHEFRIPQIDLAHINMIDANAYMPGAPTIYIPAMRVALSSVTSWWVSPWSQGEPGPSAAAAFGAGAVVGGLIGASDLF
jgi:hypothetical protein